jgi:hypothetical protein
MRAKGAKKKTGTKITPLLKGLGREQIGRQKLTEY